ncbi:DUF934 domain-containing protein [Piscinibacter sp.]|jgi:uncharacterized protein (DUF934 family)|uniref:DUF934 domain-containing protein n=1 Tax=Piscinibacter sp. TaxID=1903157 RepID=UPI00355970D4
MKFIDTHSDPWHTITGEDGPMVTLTPTPHSLLTLAQWNGVKHQWPADAPVGVAFPNDADIEDLAEDLPRLTLVALPFPKWVDGRAYSQARLLRSRYRFSGQVRATGEVLVDMLPLLKRTGFDAVVLRADQSIDAAERALRFFPGHYQGDAQEPRPLFARPAGEEYASAEDFVQAGASI